MDLAELKQRVAEGKPLYGESDQPLWVQNAAHNSSAFSQLKLRMFLSNGCFFCGVGLLIGVCLFYLIIWLIDAFPWYVFSIYYTTLWVN